jgi:hypothetical protein
MADRHTGYRSSLFEIGQHSNHFPASIDSKASRYAGGHLEFHLYGALS